jgi:hypothetical protein
MLRRSTKNSDPSAPVDDVSSLSSPTGSSGTSSRPIRKSRLRRTQQGSSTNKPKKNVHSGATVSSGGETPIVFALLVVILSGVLVVLGWILLMLWSNDTPDFSKLGGHAEDASHTTLGLFPPAYPKMTRDVGSALEAATATKLSPEAIEMCTNTLWHTLETTTIVLPDNETFIHTGDIDDLWLRDSAAQVHPLLISSQQKQYPNGASGPLSALIAEDPKLDRIVAGLIKRTAMYIRHDPYANAFRIDDSYIFSKAQKKLGRHEYVELRTRLGLLLHAALVFLLETITKQ